MGNLRISWKNIEKSQKNIHKHRQIVENNRRMQKNIEKCMNIQDFESYRKICKHIDKHRKTQKHIEKYRTTQNNVRFIGSPSITIKILEQMRTCRRQPSEYQQMALPPALDQLLLDKHGIHDTSEKIIYIDNFSILPFFIFSYIFLVFPTVSSVFLLCLCFFNTVLKFLSYLSYFFHLVLTFETLVN